MIFNTDYYGKEVSGQNYPWCAAFLWDIFRMCKAEKLFCDGAKTAYCPYIHSWGQRSGQLVDKTKGEYGDIVLFGRTVLGRKITLGSLSAIVGASTGLYERVNFSFQKYDYLNYLYFLNFQHFRHYRDSESSDSSDSADSSQLSKCKFE